MCSPSWIASFDFVVSERGRCICCGARFSVGSLLTCALKCLSLSLLVFVWKLIIRFRVGVTCSFSELGVFPSHDLRWVPVIPLMTGNAGISKNNFAAALCLPVEFHDKMQFPPQAVYLEWCRRQGINPAIPVRHFFLLSGFVCNYWFLFFTALLLSSVHSFNLIPGSPWSFLL